MSDAAADVRGRLDAVRRRITGAGGDPDRTRVVAVAKGHGADAVRAAAAAGCADIGENYAGELLEKAAALDEPTASRVRWHFVGTVQRNKVGALAPLVDTWHAVDRVEEAERIGRFRPGARVLVEVALAAGPGRGGVDPAEVADLVVSVRSRADVSVVGLMAVGPPGGPERARSGFRWMADEARRLGLDELSMGMSADLEVAVQEGSTMLRIGTALFGPRPGAPDLGR